MRRLLVIVPLTGLLAAGGCGFLHASDVGHNKPSGFVLRGHVTVPLADAATAAAGSACTAPTDAADIVRGATVTITDPGGKAIAHGSLGAGVLARGPGRDSCDFPFEIPGVPGGVDTYGIAVGQRPAQTFPAKALREDQTAVVTVSPNS